MKRQLLAGFLSCLLLFDSVHSYASISALDRIELEYGIPIHYEYNYSTYFADTLLQRNCTKQLSARNPELINSFMVAQTIENFLNRYPKQLIKRNIRGIYLLNDLFCNHIPYGGTVSEKGIYVEVYKHTDNNWLSNALHHEFSSMLIRYNTFDMRKFVEISGYDAYRSDTEQDCLRFSNCRSNADTRLYENGFLDHYALTSHENDINVYAEYMFVHERQLKELASRYPLIDKKYLFLKDFYRYLGVKF